MLVDVETVLDRALGLEDLDVTPDDGNRCEVLDGGYGHEPAPGNTPGARNISVADLVERDRETPLQWLGRLA